MAESPPERRRAGGDGADISALLALGLLLVLGAVILCVTLWPGSGRRDENGDPETTDPGSQEPVALIATDEGVALLADVLDNQLERISGRRLRHAREAVTLLDKQTADWEAQQRAIRDASETLAREAQRLPAGAERTALQDVCVKLSIGPTISANERFLARKYEKLLEPALRFTRNGALPLSELHKRQAAERAALEKRIKQEGARLEEQTQAMERIAQRLREFEDFDGALAAAGQAIQRDRRFGEALTMSGALNLIVKGEYGRAIVDCDSAVRLDPANAGALLIRGFGAWQRGSPGTAQADFQAAIRLEPHWTRHRVVFRLLE